MKSQNSNLNKLPYLGRLKLIESWLPSDAQHILEIGCAWGYLLASLRHHASQRYGLDINRAHIRDANLTFRHRAVYLCGRAEGLSFPSGTFDVIIMSEVLEHTRDETQALTEAARVLQPQGVLILTVPHRGPLGLTDLTNWKYRLPRLHRSAYGWKHRGDFSRFVPVTQYHRHYALKQL